MRLRPSGGEGELVPSLEGLQDYFRGSAEVWEMQSFLKARPVAGDRRLAARAVELIEDVIQERSSAQGAEVLRDAVDEMRRRLIRESQRDVRRSVKLGAGGLFDIHFIIEFLQLRHRVSNPPDKDTLRLLTHLNRLGHLSDAHMQVLYKAYLFFRALDHEMRLIDDRPTAGLPEDPARLAEIASAFESLPADPAARVALLKETFVRHAASVHSVYTGIVR